MQHPGNGPACTGEGADRIPSHGGAAHAQVCEDNEELGFSIRILNNLGGRDMDSTNKSKETDHRRSGGDVRRIIGDELLISN